MGYGTAVMSGAILFIADEFHLTAGMNGLVVGIVLLGALFGAIASGLVGDYWGRKKLLIIAASLFVIGSLETAFSPTIPYLMLGRVLIGISIGIASYTAPLYISEISPPKKRGALVSLYQVAVSTGFILSYVVDYFYVSDGGWRWMLGFGVVPGGIFLIGMSCLPNSPRWILFKGHEQKAREILQKIRGHGAKIDEELHGIKKTLKDENVNWRVLFSKKIRPVLWIGCGLSIIQQVTGINTIFYYAPTVFQMAGFKTASAALFISIGIGLLFLIVTIVSLLLVDRLGRRPLLLSGLVGMTIGLAFLVWTFYYPSQNSTNWLAVFSLCLYMISFGISLGPIPWLMIAEIYPLKIRGVGASIATAVNWTANFLVTVSFLKLIELIEPSGTFLLYMVLSIISWVFVYLSVPETKGVSLEEIEEHLMSGVHLRKLGK